MKKAFIFKTLSIVLVTILLSSFMGVNNYKASTVTAGPELLITEVLPMAVNGDDVYEYIEIYNNTSRNIDLKNYKFLYPELDISTSKILQPRGTIVVCLNSSTSLDSFNRFYGTQLTSSMYLQLGSGKDILPNEEAQYVILSSDDGNSACIANYKPEDFDFKKSVEYKYPNDDIEMVKLAQKQTPTPGSVDSDQVPYTQIAVTAVKLNNLTAEIKVGSTLQLISTITPTNATNKNVNWSSSNSAIAQVYSNGLVYGKTVGTAVITVRTLDGDHSARCIVTVKPALTNIPVRGINLNKTSEVLEAGKTLMLTAEIIPSNATNKQIIWTSTNSNIAAVSASGEVSAKTEGTVVIIASTPDGDYKDTCVIRVIKAQRVSVTGITLNKHILSLTTRKSESLVASILPQNASNKNIVWNSQNTEIAKVDQFGKVTAIKQGTTTITAKTQDRGYIATCRVVVTGTTKYIGEVTGIRLNHYVLVIKDDKVQKLVAIIEPGNATNKKVTWSSSDKTVAEISQDGRVIAISEGVSTITATTVDGGLTAKCIVVVIDNKNHGKGHKK